MVDHTPLTIRDLLSCMELGKALTAELHSEELFSKILHKISELLPAENWSLLLLDEVTGELHFEVSLSASFGIATFPEDAGDVTGLLALADRAMFDVKEKGKDAIKGA